MRSLYARPSNHLCVSQQRRYSGILDVALTAKTFQTFTQNRNRLQPINLRRYVNLIIDFNSLIFCILEATKLILYHLDQKQKIK